MTEGGGGRENVRQGRWKGERAEVDCEGHLESRRADRQVDRQVDGRSDIIFYSSGVTGPGDRG